MNIAENEFKLEIDEEFIRKLPTNFKFVPFFRFRQGLVRGTEAFHQGDHGAGALHELWQTGGSALTLWKEKPLYNRKYISMTLTAIPQMILNPIIKGMVFEHLGEGVISKT